MNYQNTRAVAATDKKNLLRTTTIIHSALIIGQVMFALAVVFAATKGRMSFSIPKTTDIFVLVVPVFAVACTIAGTFLYTSYIKKIKEKTLLTSKIQQYTSALIVRSALAEGPSLFAIVVSMLTLNFFYLIIAALLILYMLSFRPTADRIDNALDLRFEDKMAFESQNDFR